MDDATAAALKAYGDRWSDEFKRRNMPTVSSPRKNVVYDEMTRLKETTDWPALLLLAEPFQLYTQRGELTVDHYFDISIRHDTHGYATRRVSGNALSAEADAPAFIVRDAIIAMKKELGFGSSVYNDLKEKEEVPIVLAQPQRHTCKEHGNQLVSARNPKTDETALRCPVEGCTTILRKRRKSGPSEDHYDASFRKHTEAAIKATNVMHPDMGQYS